MLSSIFGKNPRTTIIGIMIAIAGVLAASTKPGTMATHDWIVLVGMCLAAALGVVAKDGAAPAPAPIAVTIEPAAKAASKVSGLFIGLMSALVCVVLFAISLVGCIALTGCTAAQGKAVVPVVEAVLSDIQKGCVVAQMFDAIDPPLAADIAVACGIDASLVKLIEAEMPVGTAARSQLVALELAKPVGARRFAK